MLELSKITKTYHSGQIAYPVLHGIDLSIAAGELLAIMGASGSGKSTLMNIIGLLDVPSSGSYQFAGVETSALNDDQRADYRNQTMGFVFQQFNLLPRLTILQNVMLPLNYRAMPQGEKITRAQEVLTQVGLGDKVQRRPTELSGGQQQRVAIARALVGSPQVLLADEPTGALDSRTGETILDIFMGLNQETQTTIIIVTHDAQVASHCHRLVHIADGLLVDTS